MKRILTLTLALAFVLGAVGAAKAVDVKVKGNFEFAFGHVGSEGGAERKAYFGAPGEDSMQGDEWQARQRTRIQIDFIASEQLKGVLHFEIGDLNWGRNGSGGASGGGLDADGVNVKTKSAFIDWLIPHTEVAVRMGIQPLALPFAGPGGSNPIFYADVAGITVSAPINDMFSVVAFWARPFDAYGSDIDSNGNVQHYNDETDMFGLVLPIKGQGWGVTPWGVLANVGNNSGFYQYYLPAAVAGSQAAPNQSDNGSDLAWWAGTAIEIKMFDPLTFGMDVAYGRVNKQDLDFRAGTVRGTPTTPAFSMNAGTRGWFIDAALNYKLDWATPGIFGWWSSGDDMDDVEDGWLGRIATLGGDMGFKASSFGFAGSNGRGADDVISQSGAGTWGIGAQLANFSFLDPKLSHTLRVLYYQGTNDADVAQAFGGKFRNKFDDIYMTDKDSAWEVNFEHTYKMYENLTVYLEMGYIRLDMDADTWEGVLSSDARKDNMWKSQLLFKYAF